LKLSGTTSYLQHWKDFLSHCIVISIKGGREDTNGIIHYEVTTIDSLPGGVGLLHDSC